MCRPGGGVGRVSYCQVVKIENVKNRAEEDLQDSGRVQKVANWECEYEFGAYLCANCE